MTRSNRCRKLLQTFLANSFLSDRHPLFTDTLSSYVLTWRVLQAFSLMSVHKLKLGGFKSGDCGTKSLWTKTSFWYPTGPAQSLPCVQCSILSEDVVWFLSGFLAMKELTSVKLLCERQSLACIPVQTKKEAFSPHSMLQRQVSWLSLIPYCWHSAVLKDIISRCYDSNYLFVEDRINDECFFIGKN